MLLLAGQITYFINLFGGLIKRYSWRLLTGALGNMGFWVCSEPYYCYFTCGMWPSRCFSNIHTA
jgi:hypothetical protein